MYNQKLMSALKKIGSHTGKFVLKSTMVMNTNTLSPKKKDRARLYNLRYQ